MKLYLYFLETSYQKEKHFNIKTKECEVVEKPKTYRPVKELPDEYFGSYVPKSQIGKVSGWHNNQVILTENNVDLAKKLFLDYLNLCISNKEKEIEEYNKMIEAVNVFQSNN